MTVPNGGITNGQVWSVGQWTTAWNSKADDAYTPPGTGTVATTVASALTAQVTSIYNWMTPTQIADSQGYFGSFDVTAAMNAAHATGNLIYYPDGVYKFSSGVTIPGGGIIGAGAYRTIFNTTDTTSATLISYTGSLPGRFENFLMQTQTGPGQKPGGYSIVVGPAAGEVAGMRYWQVTFSNIPNCINSLRASAWTMTCCNFYNFTGIGVNIDNQNNGQSGDSTIQGCIFTSPVTGTSTAIGINEVSSGGIKMLGNKFNNLNYGYLMTLGNIVGSTNASSDTVFIGNSVEGCATAGVAFFRQGGATSLFANINVSCNQFFVQSTSGIAIYSSDSSGFLSNFSACDNIIGIASTATSGIAINLNYITNCVASNNTIQAAVAGSTFGIIMGSGTVGGRIAGNQIRGCNTSVSATTGVNLAAGDLQTGTTNVTTSTALGTLFSGTGTITFPTTFCAATAVNLADCNVYITTAGGGGGIAAYPISVSQTQLFFGVSGATNGGSVPVRWSVKGVL